MDEQEFSEFKLQESDRIARKILKAAIQKRKTLENSEGLYIRINSLSHYFPTDECIITYHSEKLSGQREEEILFGRAYCVQTPHTQTETPEEEFRPLTTSDKITKDLPVYIFYFEKGGQFMPSIRDKKPPVFKFEKEGEIDPVMAKLLKRIFK